MEAFTEEQTKILEALFEHVWARMEHLHTDLYNSAGHVTAIGRTLLSQGTITLKQLDAADKARAWPPEYTNAKTTPSEPETMRSILRGDMSALRLVLEEEARLQEKRARDGTKQ